MTTPNLTYNALDTASNPVNDVQLTLTPYGSDGTPGFFYGTSHILAPFVGATDANGNATITNVPSNADTSDVGSYYLFEARGEVANGTGYLDSFSIVVPHGAGPFSISAIHGGPTPVTVTHNESLHSGDIWPDGTNQDAGASTLIITQQPSGGVATPAAGDRTLFVRDSDNHFALKKSDGSVVDLEASGSGLSGGVPALTLGTTNAGGAAGTGVRTDATIAVFDATVPTSSAVGDAVATGSAAIAARRDHLHGRESFAVPAIVLSATAAAGVAATPIRSDATIAAFTIAAPGNSAVGDTAASGSAAFASRNDHRHGREAFGASAANVGTSSAGAATTPSRSDHVHATGAGTPSTQAFGDAAATGTGPAAAMTDHKHAMPNSTAGPDADITIDAAGAAGTASTAARAAHGHKLATSATAALATTTAAGTAGTSGHAPSRDDHTHQTGAHGATEHTDITRSIWQAAANMPGNNTDGSTLTAGGAAPDRITWFALADAATQGFVFDFLMPADCKATTPLNAVIYWIPGSTDGVAHTVRWSADMFVLGAGVAYDTAGTTTTWTGDSAARTIKLMAIESTVQVLASVSANDLVRGNLRRVGADAADTYVGVVQVVGIRFDYTATQ